MNDNYLFIPIFKTKATAEPAAIEACSRLFSDRIIPFVEVVYSLDDNGYVKVKGTLNSVKHFIQLYRRNTTSLEESIVFAESSLLPTSIPTIHIKTEDEINLKQDEIHDFIHTFHDQNRGCALRINSGLSYKRVIEIARELGNQDFLIIDIADNTFNSSKPYLEIFYNTSNKYTTVIFSNERKKNISNRLFEDNQFSPLFNNTVIDAIKDGTFIGDGFGSFCSAKDDINQQVPTKANLFAAFLIYRFQENKIYVIKSDKPDYISTAYSTLKPKIQLNVDKYLGLFQNTPISQSKLMDLLNNTKKGNASAYIGISIIHYIEEINNNLIHLKPIQ